MELEQKLKFQIILPKYRDEHSAYRLTLVVHRHGDGTFPDFSGGEAVVLDEYQPVRAEALTKTATFHDFFQPRLPDYKSDILVKKIRRSPSRNEPHMSWLEITGTVNLMATIRPHTIRAATLLISYWPDRRLPDAYIEVCIKETNE
ncbi:hypothetical protein D3C80_1587940 [compost metagenome]